ncbi:hypothetical protein ABNF93_22510 [Actinopolymorpha sp. B9G3]
MFDVLARVFTSCEDDFDERPPGQSALAAFVVSDEGRPLLGSEVLSSCAWATGRALHPGPGSAAWLTGFDAAQREFGTGLAELTAAELDDARARQLGECGHAMGRPIGVKDLEACRDLAAEIAAVKVALPHLEIRIRCEMVGKRTQHNVDGYDFLNSFIASTAWR